MARPSVVGRATAAPRPETSSGGPTVWASALVRSLASHLGAARLAGARLELSAQIARLLLDLAQPRGDGREIGRADRRRAALLAQLVLQESLRLIDSADVGDPGTARLFDKQAHV